MYVFISWSGRKAKDIAEVFRGWLPGVLQGVKPFHSPADTEKGSRWATEVAKALASSEFGLLCLTRDSLDAPWVMFEAGALSRNLERSRVSPILFDIEPADLTGPLLQFQATRFEKSEIRDLIRSINSARGEGALDERLLDPVFEVWWPKLIADVQAILKRPDEDDRTNVRTERDLIEEVLDLARLLTKRSEGISVNNSAVIKVCGAFSQTVNTAVEGYGARRFLDPLTSMGRALVELIAGPGESADKSRRDIEYSLAKLQAALDDDKRAE